LQNIGQGVHHIAYKPKDGTEEAREEDAFNNRNDKS
jgi:hypothetical protein